MDVFARLKPWNVSALCAFNNVWETFDKNPGTFRHHKQFMYRDTYRTPVSHVLSSHSYDQDNSSTAASSPERPASPETTVLEDFAESKVVWTGEYVFHLAVRPEKPRTGWRCGHGMDWDNDPNGHIELMLATVDDAKLLRVHDVHITFNLAPASGAFATYCNNSDNTTSVDSFRLNAYSGLRLITRPEVLITVGDLQYKLYFTIADEAVHQMAKRAYMALHLEMKPPIPHIAMTPSKHDVSIGGWTIFKTVGGYGDSSVRAALSADCQYAVIKKLARKSLASAHDSEIARYRDVKSRLKDHRYKKHVLHLKDVLSRPEPWTDMYLVFKPLVEQDFSFLEMNTRVPFDTKLQLYRQAIRGVAAIHQAGYMHHDIKPDNLGIGSLDPPHAVVLDLELIQNISHNTRTGLISCGEAAGTYGYHAPEVERADSRYGQPADVWALGCVGYQIFHEENMSVLPWVRACNPWRDPTPEDPHPGEPGWIIERQRAMVVHQSILAQLRQAPADSVRNLLATMLTVRPEARPRAEDIDEHPCFKHLPEVVLSTTRR